MTTIRVPEIDPSPTQDCERLKKAFQGWGTDEKAIIWILGHRNATQRRLIKDTYKELYNQSLLDHLEAELSGDFGKAVVLWSLDPPERDAKIANGFLKKKKAAINLQVIVEIACATPPLHLMAVRQAYCALFDRSFEEDIVSNVALPLRKLLVGLVSSFRYDGEVVDGEIAETEAVSLREAIERKQLDHDDVVHILSTRNMFQLRATFQIYEQKYGNPIDQDIKNCGNGDLQSILQVVIWCIVRPEKHFAQVVRNSILGIGTDEDSLTRAIVTRAEIDMMKIRGEYNNLYQESLDTAVIGDTSGDYKDFLLTLMGARV
ncbi:Annexin D3 [Ranunculus cassubicifolius]